VVPSDRTRGNGHKLKRKKFQLDMRKFYLPSYPLYFEGDRALEQVAQRVCGFSFSGDIQTCLDEVLCRLL